MNEDDTKTDAVATLAKVTIANPVPDEVQQMLIKRAYARCDELASMLVGLPADADKKALTAMKRAVKAADEDAKNFPEAVAEWAIKSVGLEALKTQLAVREGRTWAPGCVRGRLATMLKDIDARLEALKDPEPVHTYVLQVECTDNTLDALKQLLEKNGAKSRCTSAQTDKAARQIDKWFEENL